MFEQILQLIREYDTIIIHRHNNPDGDAIGSQVGLKHIITHNFPTKTVYMVGDHPKHYSFVEGSQMDEIQDSVYDNALAIVLDTAASKLISDNRYTLAPATARMDHHIFCENICQAEVVDTSFESCCGLVAHFALECGLRLNPQSAKALYTGMVTDSGRFRYDSTTARTFAIASKLLEQGVDTNDIFRKLYADSLENKQLKAQFIMKVKLTANKVAYIYTTREEFDALGLDTFTVSRGMVNTMADIKGVGIWVNFTETEKGVLCELRSGDLNINPIAVKYGGGGHAKASGATVADRETAMAMLADLDAMLGDNA